MKITLLCSDSAHPIRARLDAWRQRHTEASVELVERKSLVGGGDFLFLISCHEIVDATVRARYRHVLVLYASDLLADRGWSPHIWAVLRGDAELTVSLLVAEDALDSGAIWHKEKIPLEGNEVSAEINEHLFAAELRLLDWAVTHHETVVPVAPHERATNYLPRRTPEDSRLDPERTLAEQFDVLRVADAQRSGVLRVARKALQTYSRAVFRLNGANRPEDQPMSTIRIVDRCIGTDYPPHSSSPKCREIITSHSIRRWRS